VCKEGEETPVILTGSDIIRLNSIGYEGPVAEFYATTDLV
jgi:hypothetical protein